MIDDSNDETNIPEKLLLTDIQVFRFCKDVAVWRIFYSLFFRHKTKKVENKDSIKH